MEAVKLIMVKLNKLRLFLINHQCHYMYNMNNTNSNVHYQMK